MLDVMHVYWCHIQFGVALSEVEYLLDLCMSMQQHLYTLLIVFMLHLLHKGPNRCLASPLVICHEYPNSKGEFKRLMIDSTLPSSCLAL
jgi:hypothetical protein